MKITTQWWVNLAVVSWLVVGCSRDAARQSTTSTAGVSAPSAGMPALVDAGAMPTAGTGEWSLEPITCGALTCSNPLATAGHVSGKGLTLFSPCCLPDMTGCGYMRGGDCRPPLPLAPLCPPTTFAGTTSCCQVNGMCGSDGTPIGVPYCSSLFAVANAKCDGTIADPADARVSDAVEGDAGGI